MKNILIAITALCIICVSCTKEQDELGFKGNGAVSFTASVISDSRSEAKDSWAQDSTDHVGVYMPDSYMNIPYTVCSDGSLKSDGNSIFYAETGTYNFFAYYPYDQTVSDKNVSIDITKQKDLLISGVETDSKEEEKGVEFTFSHALSFVEIEVNCTDDSIKLSDLKIYLTDSYTTGSYELTNALSVETSVSDSVSFSLADNQTNFTASAITMPYNYTSNAREITIYFEQGSQIFSKSFSPKWDQGYKYTYSATVGDQAVDFTLNSSIAWQTYTSESITAQVTTDILYNNSDPDYPVYEIYSAKGLKAFADLVNYNKNTSNATMAGGEFNFYADNRTINGKLMNDIDLSTICGSSIDGEDVSWTPIGDYFSNDTLKYGGEFDGNFHTITNLYINQSTSLYQGLFGYMENGKVSNLSIEGEMTVGHRAGAIVGQTAATQFEYCSSSVTIKGQTSYSDIVYSYNTSYIGGLVGFAGDASSFYRCDYWGTITTVGYYAGGIAGYAIASFDQCYNRGSITALGEVGGLTGYFAGTADFTAQITDCYNNGTGATTEEALSYIGGLAAKASTLYIIVKNSYNTGQFTVADDASGIGGLFGYYAGDTDNITTCYFLEKSSVNSYKGGSYQAIGNLDPNFDAINTETKKTYAQLVNYLFYQTLNENTTASTWKRDATVINDSYPILSWQNI